MKVTSLSLVRLLATPWTAAHQAALSMGFSRQEYWSGVPLPSPVPKFRFLQISSGEKRYVSIIFICARPLSFDFAYSGLYAGQEATVRTGQGTTDWFPVGKGVCQGWILSPCLFNSYAEYMMRNAGLEEVQAAINIAGRNINNLRYADDTTLMAESEEELKSILMKVKVKVESKNVGLKLNIQKTKIIASGPITSWQIDGETGNSDRLYFLGLQNHCRWCLQP